MERVRFGRTGLMVSRLSLGTVELGMDYGIGGRRPDFGDAARLLHRALDLGINLIDTARAYGTAEEVLGQALAARRREYILTSKALPDAATIPASIDESLRLLRTDVIDILMLHSTPLEVIGNGEAAGALVRAREQGKIRFTGASVYGTEAARAAIQSGSFDCVQVAYSALDRRPEAVFPDAVAHDIGIQARSVLLKGVLTERRRVLPAAMADLARAADALGGPLPELAYRFAISATPPDTVLVGTADIRELEEAVAWIDKGALGAAELERIRAVAMPREYWLNPSNWPPV